MLLRKFLILELPEAASRRTHRRRSNSFTGSGARLRAHPIRRTMPRFALLRPRRYGSLRTRHARAPNRRCRIGLGEPHRQYRRDGFPAAHRRHRRTIAGPRRACAWPGLSGLRAADGAGRRLRRIGRAPERDPGDFGDAIRVPGSRKSLLQAMADGADVCIVYSPLDALKIARDHPDKEVVFFALGLETTMPSTA